MATDKLIDQILKKDKKSFSIFYTQVVDSFFRYIKNMYNVHEADIDDIISTTFYKIWNSIDNFDKNKGNFESWSRTILKNTTKDFFKKKREMTFSYVSGSGNEDDDFNIEDTLKIEEDINEILTIQSDYEVIVKAMETLNGTEREIVSLRFIEEKTLEEIGDILGMTYGNVRVKLHRSISKLKGKIL